MENGAALRDPLEPPEPVPAAAGDWLEEACESGGGTWGWREGCASACIQRTREGAKMAEEGGDASDGDSDTGGASEDDLEDVASDISG